MGWPILGEDETVSNFSREPTSKTYMAANYRADGMAVIASGAVTHDAILNMAEEMFAGLRAGAVPAAEPARYVGGDSRSSEDLEQAHRRPMRSPASPAPIRDFYIAQVYATALGGGMSSRLFQEVREKRGLVLFDLCFLAILQGWRRDRHLCRHGRERGGRNCSGYGRRNGS